MKYKFFENEEILLYYGTNEEKWHISNKLKGVDYDLSLKDNLSSFLQIFYENPPMFLSDIFKKAAEKNISEKVLKALPFKESIIFCIKNKMFFWLELSLKWFEYIGVDEELEEAVDAVIADPKAPQSIRHKLMRRR